MRRTVLGLSAWSSQSDRGRYGKRDMAYRWLTQRVLSFNLADDAIVKLRLISLISLWLYRRLIRGNVNDALLSPN